MNIVDYMLLEEDDEKDLYIRKKDERTFRRDFDDLYRDFSIHVDLKNPRIIKNKRLNKLLNSL